LNEVEENHPVKDNLYVSLLGVTTVFRNTRDFLHKVCSEVLELLIELFDDLLGVIECVIDGRRRAIFDRIQFLEDSVLLATFPLKLLFAEGELLILDAAMLLTLPTADTRDEREFFIVVGCDQIRVLSAVLGLKVHSRFARSTFDNSDEFIIGELKNELVAATKIRSGFEPAFLEGVYNVL
jgi:hypothetical protein